MSLHVHGPTFPQLAVFLSRHTSVRIECDCVMRSLVVVLFGDLDCVGFDGPKAVQGCLHHICGGADWNRA